MLWAVCYCYLRLPCETCPFPAEQRSPELQQDRGAGVACQGWGRAPSHTLAADLCVRPGKSCAMAFLSSGTLVPVPAGERVDGEPSVLQQHTHLAVGHCCCLFFALETFLHGHLAGKLLLWCLGQLQDGGTECARAERQENRVFHWVQESGKGFLRVSRYLLIQRFANW